MESRCVDFGGRLLHRKNPYVMSSPQGFHVSNVNDRRLADIEAEYR